MSYVLTDFSSCSCSLFFFYTAAHFHLVGRLFSFSRRHFHVFPPTKFVSCFFSNALALLLMSLKTLKFSRTRLCCLFFSLLWLSPDRLSLSKKSGWKKPRVAFAIPVDWVILHWYACGAEGRAYAHVIINAQWTKFLTHGALLRARELSQKCLWWTTTSKTPK